MKISLYVLALLTSFHSYAQNKRFSGVVLDGSNDTPIPWAHVVIKRKGTGTVSNAEGEFSINIPIEITPTILEISCVGYKNKTIKLETADIENWRIYLEPDTKYLPEVVIKPIDIRQLLAEAIKKIPLNYLNTVATLTGFYRESLRYDSVRYIYISEGILKARKESYEQIHRRGEVKVLKSRKKIFFDSLQALQKIHFYGGPHIVHSRDIVINRLDFFNINKLKYYQYTIEKVISWNDKELYKITFKPLTNHGLFQGYFYLDTSSGILTSVKYKLTKEGLEREKKLLNSGSRYLDREFLINYMPINNKWIVQNIWQQGTLQVKGLNKNVIYSSEFVTTEVVVDDSSSFNYGERFQYRDFFIDKADNLDPDFWKDYTILKENSFLQKIQNKEINLKSTIDEYPHLQHKGEALPQINRKPKPSYDFALTVLFPNYTFSNVSLRSNIIDLSSAIKQSPQTTIGLHASIDVPVKANFNIGSSFTNSFGKLFYESISGGFNYSYKTTVNTRPLKFQGGVYFTRNVLRLPIGLTEGPLNINQKTLRHQVEVSLQKTFYAFQPALKVSLEINRSWDIFIKSSWLLFPEYYGHKIVFKERKAFFAKKTTVGSNDSDYTLFVDNEITTTVPIDISSSFISIGATLNIRRYK